MLREAPIRSAKYLRASKGEPCRLRIPDVCTGDTETVVPCHIRDRHTGRGVKASDISVVDGCLACHDLFDGRSGTLSKEDWLFYALRGLQETLESRVRRGVVVVPQDIERPSADRPVKPRKPAAERQPIPSRKEPWPSRKFPTRKPQEA